MDDNDIKLVVSQKNHEKFFKEIFEFYSPFYKRSFTEETIKNSALIVLAFSGNKIVGAVRVISDLTRHADIVDLIVSEEYRKKKVGTRLLNLAVGELKKMQVRNIGLTTDPRSPWLVDFYKKNGFKELEDSTYLELDQS